MHNPLSHPLCSFIKALYLLRLSIYLIPGSDAFFWDKMTSAFIRDKRNFKYFTLPLASRINYQRWNLFLKIYKRELRFLSIQTRKLQNAHLKCTQNAFLNSFPSKAFNALVPTIHVNVMLSELSEKYKLSL